MSTRRVVNIVGGTPRTLVTYEAEQRVGSHLPLADFRREGLFGVIRFARRNNGAAVEEMPCTQIIGAYRLRNIFPAAMSLHGSVRQSERRRSSVAGLSFQFVA